MELPENSVGPTDLIAYRECPRRFSYGMRRHTAKGKQSQRTTMPEADQHGAVWQRAYGSAVHVAIAAIEDGFGLERAVQDAWNSHGHHLQPEHLDELRADLEVYLTRDHPGCRTVLSETEIRVPLMEHRGRRIFFRTRIDRLLEVIDEPGVFIHVDYKSSRHPKSEVEVRDDLQLWMTNWALYEYMPEISELRQYLDQLKFGKLPTSKTAAARKKINEFLIAQVTAVIEDEAVDEHGLLAPLKNEWCAYCPILESCPILDVMVDFAKLEINLLAPSVKQGRKTVVELDEHLVPEYLARFEDAKEAQRILKRFVDALGDIVKAMPQVQRERIGYKATTRNEHVLPPEALAALADRIGSTRFLELVTVPKKRLETQLADDPALLEWALGLMEQRAGSTVLAKA